jgi:hypothetical protein
MEVHVEVYGVEGTSLAGESLAVRGVGEFGANFKIIVIGRYK